MNMKIKVSSYLILVVTFTILATSTQAFEPTWLFTIPKAESLKLKQYNVGFIYADFGIVENLEVGLHGVKYSVPQSNFAFGASFFPMGSPYVVLSPGTGPGGFHLGVKATPYIFFAGFEAPVSDNVKFIAELNNGVSAGVRIFPVENWTLDIFVGFITFEVYRYRNYVKIETEDFRPIPGIFFVYSGRL